MNDDEFKSTVDAYVNDLIKGEQDPASVEYGLMETIKLYNLGDDE